MPALIAARALQGLGGGGLIALSQTIVGDAVPPRERGRYQGYFGAVFACASIAGPVLGGVFAEHLHWSLIFWINLPLGLLAFAISGRALKALPRHGRRRRRREHGRSISSNIRWLAPARTTKTRKGRLPSISAQFLSATRQT